MTRTTRALQVVTLLLVALYLGQLYAHVLEIGPKLKYPPELYLQLNNSLYTWYGPPLGAAISIGALVATGALTWLVCRQRSARWLTGSAFALQVAALTIYFARVEPVNVRIRALPPGQVPSDFIALRAQWDYGHALGFALFVAVFLLLVGALLVRPTGTAEPSARMPEEIR
ncbi:MAG: hypothetical protein ACRDS0_08255 [Pseudonocardiaceae bacterium]